MAKQVSEMSLDADPDKKEKESSLDEDKETD